MLERRLVKLNKQGKTPKAKPIAPTPTRTKPYLLRRNTLSQVQEVSADYGSSEYRGLSGSFEYKLREDEHPGMPIEVTLVDAIADKKYVNNEN